MTEKKPENGRKKSRIASLMIYAKTNQLDLITPESLRDCPLKDLTNREPLFNQSFLHLLAEKGALKIVPADILAQLETEEWLKYRFDPKNALLAHAMAGGCFFAIPDKLWKEIDQQGWQKNFLLAMAIRQSRVPNLNQKGQDFLKIKYRKAVLPPDFFNPDLWKGRIDIFHALWAVLPEQYKDDTAHAQYKMITMTQVRVKKRRIKQNAPVKKPH